MSLPRESSHTAFWRYWRVIAARLERRLQLWVPTLVAEASGPLQEAVTGGKHIRGYLACLVNQALGGSMERVLPRAVAIECVHAASLIHDDFVDQDTTRRHHPAVWTLNGARRAVLLGDILFATAIQRIVQLGIQEGEIIADTIATIARGAYQEPLEARTLVAAMRAGRYRPEDYNRILHLKTAALFGTAARLGALAANADEDHQIQAYRFGTRLGEAFQIADDLHEIINDDVTVSSRALAPSLPALLYFCGEASTDVLDVLEEKKNVSILAAVLQTARLRMRKEITARCDLARAELVLFPANRYTRLLASAPDCVISAMLAESLSSVHAISGR